MGWKATETRVKSGRKDWTPHKGTTWERLECGKIHSSIIPMATSPTSSITTSAMKGTGTGQPVYTTGGGRNCVGSGELH
jgi:hypothetical protein